MSSSKSDGQTSPEDPLPKAVPISMALFGSSKPKPKDPLPATGFGFGQPTSPLVKGPLSKTHGEAVSRFVSDMRHLRQTKPLVESSTAPSDSEVTAVNLSKALLPPPEVAKGSVFSAFASGSSFSSPQPQALLPTPEVSTSRAHGGFVKPQNMSTSIAFGSSSRFGFDSSKSQDTQEEKKGTVPETTGSLFGRTTRTDSSKPQIVPPSLFGSSKPPVYIPSFGQQTKLPAKAESTSVFGSVFGQPRPTFASISSPQSTLYGTATSGAAFGTSGVETSPRVQSEESFSSDSESETPTVGIFGPACPFRAHNSDKLATFLSGDAHDSAKETFDLKLKGIKDKLPSPSKGYFPGESAEEDVLREELESLVLLEDLMKIEELLQAFTAGYTDTDLELIVGCSWTEGIYIASIQEKMKLMGRNWKANFDPLEAEHIEAVDGVPRSQGELKILLKSIAG